MKLLFLSVLLCTATAPVHVSGVEIYTCDTGYIDCVPGDPNGVCCLRGSATCCSGGYSCCTGGGGGGSNPAPAPVPTPAPQPTQAPYVNYPNADSAFVPMMRALAGSDVTSLQGFRYSNDMASGQTVTANLCGGITSPSPNLHFYGVGFEIQQVFNASAYNGNFATDCSKGANDPAWYQSVTVNTVGSIDPSCLMAQAIVQTSYISSIVLFKFEVACDYNPGRRVLVGGNNTNYPAPSSAPTKAQAHVTLTYSAEGITLVILGNSILIAPKYSVYSIMAFYEVYTTLSPTIASTWSGTAHVASGMVGWVSILVSGMMAVIAV